MVDEPVGRPSRPRHVTALATVLAVLISGCAQAATTSTRVEGSESPSVAPATLAPSSVEPVGPDGPGGPPEGAIMALVAYSEQHRDAFGGLYIDPPGGQSVVMLFTRDLETHERAVNELVPGTRVRQVQFTESELRTLQDFLARSLFGQEGVEFLSAGTDVIGNKVVVAVMTDDRTVELRLEASHPGMLDVSVYPVPGPWDNVASGAGWRLLAAGDTRSEAYTVRAATSPAEWEALWTAVDIRGDQPAVDLDAEVVVSLGHGLSKSCPELRLDDIVIGGGVVFSLTSDPLQPRGCNFDLTAASVFVVALDRDALPADGFTLQLSRDTNPGCLDCGFVPILDVDFP